MPSPWLRIDNLYEKVHSPIDTRYGRKHEQQTDQSPSRNARSADFESAGHGRAAWTGNFPAYRSDHAGDIRREAGLVVSGAAPHGRGGLVVFVLGRFREQPPREVLSAHQGRP